MRRIILGAIAALGACMAHAGGTASIGCVAEMPVVTVNYTPGVDAGVPGLFYLGVLSPDQKEGAVLTMQGGWRAYEGGLYPPQQRYDNGLPGSVSLTLQFPSGGPTTAPYVGYVLYAGHGAYTSDSARLVAQRRATLNAIKPQRVAAGAWRPENDNDEQFMQALVQKNMTSGQKFAALLTIPSLNCAPDNSGG